MSISASLHRHTGGQHTVKAQNFGEPNQFFAINIEAADGCSISIYFDTHAEASAFSERLSAAVAAANPATTLDDALFAAIAEEKAVDPCHARQQQMTAREDCGTPDAC